MRVSYIFVITSLRLSVRVGVRFLIEASKRVSRETPKMHSFLPFDAWLSNNLIVARLNGRSRARVNVQVD